MGISLFSLADNRQDFVLAEDEVLLAVDLDVRARVLAEEDLVSGLDVEGDLGPVLEDLAVTDGDDLAFLGFFLGGVGDDDPALDRLLLFDALDDQAVVQWPNFHAKCLLSNRIWEAEGGSSTAGTLPWRVPNIVSRRPAVKARPERRGGTAEFTYCFPIGPCERLLWVSHRSVMGEKTDVWQGTLARMLLETLEALGPLQGNGLAR